jgi:hypothetical protein
MSGKYVLIIVVCFALAELPRKDAKAQRGFSAALATLRLCVAKNPEEKSVPVEVVPILDLPLAVHEASLVKAERGYFLKLKLGNSSDTELVGIRYALVRINSRNQTQPVAYRSEGFSLAAYASNTLTLKTPLKFKPTDGERLALMLEQVISRDTIWDVVKAKDAMEAYVRSDFSITPRVIRVANQVDAPIRPTIRY